MTFDELVAQLDAEPYGFANCVRRLPDGSQDPCPHLRPQTDRVCGPCVLHHVHRPEAPSCHVCCAPMPEEGNGICGNWLCRSRSPRWFDRVYAIALGHGEMYQAVLRYKEKAGWALPFGRVISWELNQSDAWDDYDLITSLPHAIGERNRNYDPGQRILDIVEKNTRRPPTDAGEPIILKTEKTPSMRDTTSAAQREQVAKTRFYPALSVPIPERIRGRRIVVIDDTYTTGHSMNMVARKLTEEGARQVTGLVLMRAV